MTVLQESIIYLFNKTGGILTDNKQGPTFEIDLGVGFRYGSGGFHSRR